jgi:hypothetical protein
MVLDAPFNNISVISLRSVLLVEETVEPGENHRQLTNNFFEMKCMYKRIVCYFGLKFA